MDLFASGLANLTQTLSALNLTVEQAGVINGAIRVMVTGFNYAGAVPALDFTLAWAKQKKEFDKEELAKLDEIYKIMYAEVEATESNSKEEE